MSTRNARTIRIGLPAFLVAGIAMAATGPQARAQFHLPRLLPAKTPTESSAEEETPGRMKARSTLGHKLQKLNPLQQKKNTDKSSAEEETPGPLKALSALGQKLSPSQQKMSTETLGGAVGGALAGGAFGSFAGPAGTVIGAAGGALAGGVGSAAASTFKDYARRHWKWR